MNDLTLVDEPLPQRYGDNELLVSEITKERSERIEMDSNNLCIFESVCDR